MRVTGGPGQSGSPLCALGAADCDSAIVDVFFFILIVVCLVLLAQEQRQREGRDGSSFSFFGFIKKMPRFL